MRQKCLLVFLCFIGITLLLACSGMQKQRLGRIDATIRFDIGQKISREIDPTSQSTVSPILPSGGWTPLSYILSGSGPGGASFTQEAEDGGFSIECTPGEWLLEAWVISQDTIELARGSCNCILQPGKTSRADITLYPLEGNGELSVYVIKNLEMPTGSRLVGQLRFKGLPGQASPSQALSIPIDKPATENELLFPELPAGYYILSLELKAEDGFVSGGCAIAALVLKDYTSSGACEIVMGLPVAGIGLELYPNEPLAQALLSVEHSVPEGVLALPIAVSKAGDSTLEAIQRIWYRNGSEVGSAVPILQGPAFLPADSFIFPLSSNSQEASVSRIDYTEEGEVSHRFGTGSLFLHSCDATQDSGWKATAVYDYRAAMGPSLCPHNETENQGSGQAEEARSIAASESGLIVAADFDADKYLHAFLAAYESTLAPPAQSVPSSASWLRLWRSRIRAQDPKSSDCLAVSADGRLIAAAATQGAWIWLGHLGEQGEIVSTSYLTSSSSNELEHFGNVKALCFSPSGDRLYAACSTAAEGRIFAFSTSSRSLELIHSKDLIIGTTTALPISDMVLTASGLLAVSSKDASKIVIFQDGASLEILYYLENTGVNTGLDKPIALATSIQGDSFYALCNGENLVRFSRADSTSLYTKDSLIPLALNSQGAKMIAAGHNGSALSESVLVVGGDCFEFIDISADGSQTASQIIDSEDIDSLGVAAPSSICFCRGAFLISGGVTGKIAVFGNSM
jgi:hypothetical protein